MYENQICEKDSQIEGMKTNLIEAENAKRQQEEHFKQQLLEEAARRQQRDWYYPQAGDQLDEMFAAAVNACPFSVVITRLGDGQYNYGSKKIFAKIMSDKLVIRVQGGYMLVEEFLKNYAEAESRGNETTFTGGTGRASPKRKAPSPKGRAGSPGFK